MSEDVMDNARWCNLCQTSEHSECEFNLEDFQCVICLKVISDEEYELDGTGFCDAHRPKETSS